MSTLSCAYCADPVDDWCPACRRTLCQRHGEQHRGSFDEPCTQGDYKRVQVPLHRDGNRWWVDDVSLGLGDDPDVSGDAMRWRGES